VQLSRVAQAVLDQAPAGGAAGTADGSR
jgi:hypothetical protein